MSNYYRSLKSLVLMVLAMSICTSAFSKEVITISTSTDFLRKVSKSNIIYDIKCDVNLNGSTVKIPANCILRFTSGSISNGKLEGSQTFIDNSSNYEIFNNVSIADKPFQFTNDYVYVDWFSGRSDSDRMQQAIVFSKKNRNPIHFLSREYEFNSTVIVDMNHLMLAGTTAGGEYGELGTKISASASFSSKYTGSPLFLIVGEPEKSGAELGAASGRITGISFSTNRKNDAIQFKLAPAPSRPFYIDHCSFYKCATAIRVLDNGGSTALGFLYVENCTLTGNIWNVVASGRHSLMGLYFCKNVAEQCDGNINLGYSEVFSPKPYDAPRPKNTSSSASAVITICDNLLEGTVDCIYISGGKCIVNVERNYFETSRRQFVVMTFTHPASIVTFNNNYIAQDDDVSISLRNCKYIVQSDIKKTLFKTVQASSL